LTIAVAAAIVVYLAAVSIEAYYDSTVATERTRKTLEGRQVERRALEQKHREQLSTYRWADPEQRTRVVVPIERAMELCASELAAARPGQPATLVPAVTPAHNQPTAPAIWGQPTGAVTTGGTR
jgi:hypothetical protein